MPSPWLRHRTGSARDPNADAALDHFELRIEALAAPVAAELARRHGLTQKEALAQATNLVMSATLCVQSRNAPAGLEAMVLTLVEHDPALAAFRCDLRTRSRRRAWSFAIAGVVAGLAIGIAAATLFF